jgi:hypothetical protein
MVKRPPKPSTIGPKSLAARARRASDSRRWRQRQARGAACYYVEADAETFHLMSRFEGLDLERANDRQAVANALGRLLRRALSALLQREAARR